MLTSANRIIETPKIFVINAIYIPPETTKDILLKNAYRGGSSLSQTRRMTKCFLREYNNLIFQELLGGFSFFRFSSFFLFLFLDASRFFIRPLLMNMHMYMYICMCILKGITLSHYIMTVPIVIG